MHGRAVAFATRVIVVAGNVKGSVSREISFPAIAGMEGGTSFGSRVPVAGGTVGTVIADQGHGFWTAACSVGNGCQTGLWIDDNRQCKRTVATSSIRQLNNSCSAGGDFCAVVVVRQLTGTKGKRCCTGGRSVDGQMARHRAITVGSAGVLFGVVS